MALHVREPHVVRWWLAGLAFSLGDRFLPFDIRWGTSLVASVILFVLPIIGYRRIRAAGGTFRLQQRLGYRIILGGLALAAASGMVLAANTFIVEANGAQQIGPIGTAAGCLVIAIIAWRATVRPSPRAAAFTSLVAMLLMIVASITDVVLMVARYVDSGPELSGGHGPLVGHAFVLHSHDLMLAVAVIGFFAQLAGIAALVAFEPANETIPEARVSA